MRCNRKWSLMTQTNLGHLTKALAQGVAHVDVEPALGVDSFATGQGNLSLSLTNASPSSTDRDGLAAAQRDEQVQAEPVRLQLSGCATNLYLGNYVRGPMFVSRGKLIAAGAAALALSVAEPALGAVIDGTAGDDHLIGTSRADKIYGRGGDDVIRSRAGADFVRGGPGDDVLYLSTGTDRFDVGDFGLGGHGRDRIYGQAGYDILDGGAGADVLVGGAQADDLDDGRGDDVVRGGLGPDSGWLLAGRDVAFLGVGNDTLNVLPDRKRDVVHCGAGRDTIALLDARDRLDRFYNCERVRVVNTD
jgi:Ca2+-binding RTX toxin-like protein